MLSLKVIFFIIICLNFSLLTGIISLEKILKKIKNTKYKLKSLYNNIKLESEEEYEDELKLYNEEIKKYAKYIKRLNLSDFEIIIKIIYDIWNIYGYKDECIDSKFYKGVDRLYLYKNKYGVCRHFADDMVYRLNEINPKYNARIITLEIDDNEDGYYLPIKRKKYNDDETNELISDKEEQIDNKSRKNYGNHMACLVDLPNNITLIVDPTNTSIGYIRNKTINYFECKTKYKINKNGSYIFNGNHFFKTAKDNLKLPIRNLTTYKKIDEKYGKNMQEKALERIKYIDEETISKNYKHL